MLKKSWRDRMKARKVATHGLTSGWGYASVRPKPDGDYVSARRADKVMCDLEREIVKAHSEGVSAGLAQARDICKSVRHRADLTDDERCGVLEGALAIQDEIARLDQLKEGV